MLLISFQDGRPIEVPTPPGQPGKTLLISLSPGGSGALRTVTVKGSISQLEPAIWARLRRLAAADGRALRRPLAGAVQGNQLVLLAEAPAGPTLRTALRLVPLTWDQAVVLGEGLLTALSQLQEADLVHGDISSGTAVLCEDGRVRLIDPVPTPSGDDQPVAARSDVSQAAGLLSALLARVSAPSLRSVPEDVQLALLGVAGELAQGGVQATSALVAWRRAAGPRLTRQGRTRVAKQLQALAVRLPGGLATPALGAEQFAHAPAGNAGAAVAAPPPAALAAAPDEIAASAPRPGLPARHPVAPNGSSPSGRSRLWLAAGTLVALVAVGGGALLLSHGSTRPSAQHQRGRHTAITLPSKSPATASPSPTATAPTSTPSLTPAPTPNQLAAVPYLGPSSNPPVQQVQLEAGCTAAGTQGCQVTLTADLGQHAATTVNWEIEEVDRCNGHVTTVASGQIPAPANYTYVQAQPQLSLPTGVPVALVGLAGAPGQAASLPLLITPPGAQCPG